MRAHQYNALPPQLSNQTAFNQSFDEANSSMAGCVHAWGLARDESMDVSNDPRFFAKSVMDKRLGAFKSLTIVSSLMFGTSMGQCFKMKKDMNFDDWDPYVGNIGLWQLLGFGISVVVAIFCLFSLYVIAHQLFYANRLSTSGPTGFEQASVFYLTRVIVMWRHLAIKCLFNGLWLFIILVGVQLFCKFYKDADAKLRQPHTVFVVNLANGTSMNTSVDFSAFKKHHKLDMMLHSILGYIVLVIFLGVSAVLITVRKHHLTVFQENYKAVKVMTHPLESTMRAMSHRSGHLLET